MVLKCSYKDPVPILTDFINSKYEGIFLKELSLFGTLSYLYSFIKSSYFENLAKLNHVNFVNLERPCFDDFFLCAAHHIPEQNTIQSQFKNRIFGNSLMK